METNKKKRLQEWGKNLLILVLALSAISLISQSALYEGFGVLSDTKKEQQVTKDEYPNEGKREISLEPICLAVQNSHGRYGVQYDSKTTHQLFEEKLGSLLREALAGVQGMAPTDKEKWQSVLQGSGNWIYYKFSSNFPLDTLSLWLGGESANVTLMGSASSFLLTDIGGTYLLYCYDDSAKTYAVCTLTEGSGERFLALIGDIPQNGLIFAFEDKERFGAIDENVMILPQPPSMPIYEVKNPIALLDKTTQEAIMRVLSFNPSVATAFRAADSTGIKEGSGTLRIFDDGTITYHGQGSDPRYSVSQEHVGDMIARTQALLLAVMADRCGEARAHFSGLETKENGVVVIRFEYRIGGAPIKLYSEGYAAEFTIQNGLIRDFTIHLRQYTPTEEKSIFPPEHLAVAAISDQQKEKKENNRLQLAYLDSGKDLRIAANWILE